MTPQEILDVSYVGLMKQGAKSMNSYGMCCYRGIKGSKCGVGFLLSDKAAKAFDKRANNSAINLVVQGKSKYVEDWMIENVTLLKYIQSAHDLASEWSFREDVAHHYTEIAKKYNLTLPNVDVKTGELING